MILEHSSRCIAGGTLSLIGAGRRELETHFRSYRKLQVGGAELYSTEHISDSYVVRVMTCVSWSTASEVVGTKCGRGEVSLEVREEAR